MIQSGKVLTSSGLVVTGQARIAGFFVNSTSAGTLTLIDGITAGGTALSGVITPPAVGFYFFPCDVSTGLFVTVGGTLNVTILIRSMP